MGSMRAIPTTQSTTLRMLRIPQAKRAVVRGGQRVILASGWRSGHPSPPWLPASLENVDETGCSLAKILGWRFPDYLRLGNEETSADMGSVRLRHPPRLAVGVESRRRKSSGAPLLENGTAGVRRS